MKLIKNVANKYSSRGGATLEKNNSVKRILFIAIFFLVVMTSVGYAALSTSFLVSGEAKLRVPADIRITNIKVSSLNNGGYETYSADYYKDGTKIFATLPNLDSEVVYEVEITNKSDMIYNLKEINELINSNSNIEYVISEIKVGDDIDAFSTKKFLITVKYKDGVTTLPSDTTSSIELNYVFEIADNIKPTLTASLNDTLLTIIASDEGSGLSSENVYKYYLSTSGVTQVNGSWTEYRNGVSFTIPRGVYYLWVYPVKDNANNVNDDNTFGTPYVIMKVDFCDSVLEFPYTGSEQVHPIKCSGNYRLETWGAQGGAYLTYIGGYGGYSTGNVFLNENTNLYINVGGSGVLSSKVSGVVNGGYNGGGNAAGVTNKYVISGGGATHIATSSGVLSTLSGSLNNILIVSGGGGGAGYETTTNYGLGGSGGGYIGTNGTLAGTSRTTGKGGSQTTAGTGTASGSFGKGGNSPGDGTGGGGGFYGGGSGQYYAGGGGGSGYIGNTLLTDKYMYCYNCTKSDEESTKTYTTTNFSLDPKEDNAKQGDGYARITYLDIDTSSLSVKFSYESVVGGNGTITINSTNELFSGNKYQYYISDSKTSLVGGSWQNYTSGESFPLNKPIGKYYLWIYPIANVTGKINDNLLSIDKPYMLSEINILECTDTPVYTYTGTHQFIDDGNGDWRIKFTSTGDFTLTQPLCTNIDMFLVGGGGSGGSYNGSGGGGGKTTTVKSINSVEVNTTYRITIGAGGLGAASKQNGNPGGITTFGDLYSADGGTGGATGGAGGSGGSGGGSASNTGTGKGTAGAGGSNGEDGVKSTYSGGSGQGTTTREFSEEIGDLYAGGGGGSSEAQGTAGAGGAGGGGSGGKGYANGSSGVANTGGGGGGAMESGYTSGAGGSGIVVIRNSPFDFDYTYTGECEEISDGDGNWRIKFLTSGTFTLTQQQPITIDVFAVGGGGGGSYMSGGGGGYTNTIKEVTIAYNEPYVIEVGAGGTKYSNTTNGTEWTTETAGGQSSGFGCIAAGGQPGSYNSTAGNGGSGGSGNGYNLASATNGDDGVGPKPGIGQKSTTREFGDEPDGTLYSSGGGVMGMHTDGKSGADNTGDGGWGGGGVDSGPARIGGDGGSGIVVIRNARSKPDINVVLHKPTKSRQ